MKYIATREGVEVWTEHVLDMIFCSLGRPP